MCEKGVLNDIKFYTSNEGIFLSWSKPFSYVKIVIDVIFAIRNKFFYEELYNINYSLKNELFVPLEIGDYNFTLNVFDESKCVRYTSNFEISEDINYANYLIYFFAIPLTLIVIISLFVCMYYTLKKKFVKRLVFPSILSSLDITNLNNYKKLFFLGSGKFSKVYCVKDLLSYELYAIKEMRRKYNINGIDNFLKEAFILEKLRDCCHIIKIFHIFRCDIPVSLVLEYVDGGDLSAFIKSHPLKYNNALKYFEDIANGVNYIHSKDIIHMDLSLRNCLIRLVPFNVVICDFGLANELGKKDFIKIHDHSYELPVRWYSPESLENFVFEKSNDIWSMGVLFWEILHINELPYKNIGDRYVIQHIKLGTRLDISGDFYELLKLLFENKNLRPTALEAFTLIKTMRTVLVSNV